MTDDPTQGPVPEGGRETAPAAGGPPGGTAADEARLRRLLRDATGPDGLAPDPLSAIYGVRRRVRRRRLVRGAVSGCLAAAVVATAFTLPGGGSRKARPVVAGPGPTYHLTGALVSFDGCADYLSYVRDRARSEAGPYGLQPTGVYRSSTFADGLASNGSGWGSEKTAAGPMLASPSPAPVHSETDNQVAGVDEPDTVKTDGRIVVTLQGPTLYVLDTTAHVIGSLQLQGDTGGGILLDGDRVLVLSTLSTGGAVGTAGFGLSAPYPAARGVSAPSARVAVVDVADPVHPVLVRSFLFDGTLVAARLVGGQVRLVDRTDGPRLSFVDPSVTGDSASATAANQKLIAGSTLGDWLPSWQQESPDGATSVRHPISSCDAVARPRQATGLSTVSVLEIDPYSTAPGPGTSVVAAGSTVYATADRLYVAGESQPGPGPAGAGPMVYGCCTVVPPGGASTRIYVFETPAVGRPVFAGSGSVPGWLVNSYAMDEDPGGLLRVASTEMSASGAADTQVTVLRLTGSALTPVGSVRGIGQGEVIRAVRFLGARAYVVTFRSFDPLYVVDLRDPSKPVVSGQLEQPGFSEFLYPLPGQRLLGVGVEITGNEPSGLIVATYDVSDPAHPVRIDSSSLVEGAQFGYQGYDPHAFLYWPSSNLALLAVPGTAGDGSGSDVAAYTVGGGGRLTRAATLGHGSDIAGRSVIIGSKVWVVTTSGIVTADLSDLPASTWHPY